MNFSLNQIRDFLGAILMISGKMQSTLADFKQADSLRRTIIILFKSRPQYGKIMCSINTWRRQWAPNVCAYHHEHYISLSISRFRKDIGLMAECAIAMYMTPLTANRVYRKQFMPHEAAEYIMAIRPAILTPKY